MYSSRRSVLELSERQVLLMEVAIGIDQRCRVACLDEFLVNEIDAAMIRAALARCLVRMERYHGHDIDISCGLTSQRTVTSRLIATEVVPTIAFVTEAIPCLA